MGEELRCRSTTRSQVWEDDLAMLVARPGDAASRPAGELAAQLRELSRSGRVGRATLELSRRCSGSTYQSRTNIDNAAR